MFVNYIYLGVTPFASILKHIWYRQKKGNLGSLRRVEFFWVCRDAPSFGWFQSLLQEVEEAQVDRELFRYPLIQETFSSTTISSKFPAHQHLPHSKDWRRYALEHCCQRCWCRL